MLLKNPFVEAFERSVGGIGKRNGWTMKCPLCNRIRCTTVIDTDTIECPVCGIVDRENYERWKKKDGK